MCDFGGSDTSVHVVTVSYCDSNCRYCGVCSTSIIAIVMTVVAVVSAAFGDCIMTEVIIVFAVECAACDAAG